MIGRVIAMEPAEFQTWLQTGEAGGGAAAVSPAAAGQALFQAPGWESCPAAGSGQRGPELAGLFGSTVRFVDGGSVVADENYLRESILHPQAHVVAGYQNIMPTYQGLLSEENVMQLIAYLKTRGPTGAAGAAGAAAGPPNDQTMNPHSGDVPTPRRNTP
jgi:cytochrome c oxidase subunit 2